MDGSNVTLEEVGNLLIHSLAIALVLTLGCLRIFH
jgi:hypothetical protein